MKGRPSVPLPLARAVIGSASTVVRKLHEPGLRDDAVFSAVKATLFDEGFISDLTADVNARLAEIPPAHEPDSGDAPAPSRV